MGFFGQDKDFILFGLFIIGTLANILWSKKRVAVLKSHIKFLQEQVSVLSKMTPNKIKKYHKIIELELEEIIDGLEKKLEKAKKEIRCNKEQLVSIEKRKQNSTEDRVTQLRNEIEKLTIEARATEKKTTVLHKLQQDSNHYPPSGILMRIFLLSDAIHEGTQQKIEDNIKALLSNDKYIDYLLQLQKIDDRSPNSGITRSEWKNLESEAWEDFLDMSLRKDGLWPDMKNDPK